MTAKTRPIKLNPRGLVELMLLCSFLSLATFAIGSWAVNGTHVVAMDTGVDGTQAALLPRIMRNPTIITSLIVVEFTLLLAVTLATAPLAWWLRADHILGMEPAQGSTPLRWLEKKLLKKSRQATPANAQVIYDANGNPLYYQPTEMPEDAVNLFNSPPAQTDQADSGQAAPGQPAPGQAVAGQAVAGQSVGGQAVAGQAQPIPGQAATVSEVKPGQAAPTEGSAPAAPPPSPWTDPLNTEETQEDDPLADLANIKDILSSAFDEDAGIDPEREAFSRSLDEIDIATLRTTARQVLAQFMQ